MAQMQPNKVHTVSHSVQTRICPKRLHLFLWRLLRQTETSGQNPRIKLLLIDVTVCYVINKYNNVLHTEEGCYDKDS